MVGEPGAGKTLLFRASAGWLRGAGASAGRKRGGLHARQALSASPGTLRCWRIRRRRELQ
jgi:hypothetical protein